MVAINLQEVQNKIKEIQSIISQMDYIATKGANGVLYNDGTTKIEMSSTDKTKLKNRYAVLKSELETKIEELP